ncbi:MAG: PAS domain S-box protein, partial [Nitrospinota bacterium]|nr:PAS domain S-box protein [Nitrospinota bacterium]
MKTHHQVLKIIALATLYFVTSWSVTLLGLPKDLALPLYPAVGVALGALICYGVRLWPGIFLGELVFTYWFMNNSIPASGMPGSTLATICFGIAFSVTVQALLGAFLFKRFVGSSNPLDRTKDALIFIFLVGGLGCVVSPILSMGVLGGVGLLPSEKLLQEGISWWLGDVMAVLLVTPIFFVFRKPLNFRWTPSRLIEAGVLLLFFYITIQMVFGDWLQLNQYPLVYLMAPCLVWAAYRFGHPGALIAILLFSSTAVWGTMAGRGPFTQGSMEESIALLATYMVVLAIMTLILSAAVTEAENAQSQAARFGRVLDESSNEIYLFDAKTLKFIQVNRGARENLGYTMNELQSLTPIDLKPGYTLKNFEAILKPLRYGTDDLVTFQTEHQRKNGTLYPVEVRLQFSRAEVGAVFVSIIQDITERLQAEQALRESEAKFRQLTEHIEEVFWMEEASGKEIVYISPAFEKVWGLKCEDLLKNPQLWMESIHPEDRKKIEESYSYEDRTQIIKGSYDTEFRIIRPDGNVRWIRDRAFPVLNDSGEVIRIAGISEDITGHKQAQQELQENERRLSLILESTSDGVYDWDIATSHVFFSPKWFRSLGYEPGELEPHISTWEKLVHPDDMPKLREVLQAHFEGKTPYYQFENRLLTKSGTYRWNLDRGQVVSRDENGKPLRMVGTDVDITEQKQVEEELAHHRHHLEELVLQRTADLESTHMQLLHAEKLSATGKMAASMAHEFNNPIFGIRNVLEKILRRVQMEDNNKRFVQLAITECDRMAMLIRKVLDFHSPSTDEREWIDIHESIDDMILLIQKKWSMQGIRLVKEYAADMPNIEAVP